MKIKEKLDEKVAGQSGRVGKWLLFLNGCDIICNIIQKNNTQKREFMYDFMVDLDAFFCEKYADYDKLCILPGYSMPVMQATEVRENGRTYGYTLPPETMRLALQEQKTELLKKLKEQMVDKTFSFSFLPLGFFTRVKNIFVPYAFHKNFKKILKKYNIAETSAFEGVAVADEIKKGILNGKYEPTKNLILSFALVAQISYEDTCDLLTLCGEKFDLAEVKDVVLTYLLQSKTYNSAMVDAAMTEYKISNLYIA